MGLKHCSDGWENSDRMSDIMTLAYDVCGATCDKSRKMLLKTVERVTFSSKVRFMNQLILQVLHTQSKDMRE